MTILCDRDLTKMIYSGLIDPDKPGFDPTLINPASVDIRIGLTAKVEVAYGRWEDFDLEKEGKLVLGPGEFALVATMESFRVPNGYAMDLRLKSSTARRGFDHSLAFWVDPGWEGTLTMEIRNVLQYNSLTVRPGDRFAQVIVHQLSGPSASPYDGRYKGATTVEGAKS